MGAARPALALPPSRPLLMDGGREVGGEEGMCNCKWQRSAVVQVAGLCRAAQEDPLFVAAKGTCYIQSISVHPFTGILKISKSKR